MRIFGLPLATIGLICAAVAAQPVRAQSQPVARLRGTVFDSVGKAPLTNAAVRVFRSENAAEGIDVRTDSAGLFTVPSLRAGTWLLSFLHPRLDSLRLEPPLARIDIVEAGDIDVTLAVPSGRSLAVALCGARLEDSTAVVVGEVRDAAARRPIAGATVQASWPEWVFGKRSLGKEDVTRLAQSDSSGQFVLCNVPQATTVTAVAFSAADSTGKIELEIPPTDYFVADFVVDRSIGDSRPAEAPKSENDVRRGRGTIRGTLMTPDGRPLVNAIARVLGSGSTVRTDSAGTFRITDAVAGTQTLEVRAVGFEPQRKSVLLYPGTPVTVAMTAAKSTVRLDTVRVFAGRDIPPEVRRLEQRWRQGFGVIMDAETIQERASSRLSTVLYGIPGVRLGMQMGPGSSIWMRGSDGKECSPTIFLDGFPFSTVSNESPSKGISFDLTIDDLVLPADVAALEIYARPTSVPGELFTGGRCGAIAVWTKWGLGGIRVIDPRNKTRG